MSDFDETTATKKKACPLKAIPSDDVQKLCSGQVITSLEIVLKELVENSLDAGATVIDVKFKDQGLEELVVTDNGCGIADTNFDLFTCRYATSKLKSFDDIHTVQTFGFRGEALNSLCAVSDVVIITKHKDAKMATKIEFDHKGSIKKQQPTHGHVGTRVYVSNFFGPLPIRRRELQRNIKKEYSKAVDILIGYCLIYENVKFECCNIKNSKSSAVLNTIPNQTIYERIVSIFGSKEADKLLEISTESLNVDKDPMLPECSLHGWVSKSHTGCGRSNKDRQYIFLNSRPCIGKSILKSINNVYRHFNPHQYPLVMVNIIMDKEYIDINVTKDKRQLMIENETFLKLAIERTLTDKYKHLLQFFEVLVSPTNNSFKSPNNSSNKEILAELDDVSATSSSVNDKKRRCLNTSKESSVKKMKLVFHEIQSSSKELKNSTVANNSTCGALDAIQSKRVEITPFKKPGVPLSTNVKTLRKLSKNLNLHKHKQVVKTEKLKPSERSSTTSAPELVDQEDNDDKTSDCTRKITKDLFPKMKIIGQFNLGFILVSLEKDVFVVDQHASDEIYNFEDLSKNTVLQTQSLVCPQKIRLTNVNELILTQNLSVFEKNGFKFKVTEDAPVTERVQLVSRPFSKNIDFNKDDIEEIIELIKHATETHNIRPPKLRSMLASRACRKSIMIGDALKFRDMRKVIDNLSTLDEPWNCPHGRPTVKYLIKLNQ